MNLIKHTILETLSHGTHNAKELRAALDRHKVFGTQVVWALTELLESGQVRKIAGSDKFVIVGRY